MLRPVLDQIEKLWARVDLMPVVRWGTVTATGPLRVLLDGSAEPLPFAPQTTVQGLATDDRVVCVEQHRRVIVIARARTFAPKGMLTGTVPKQEVTSQNVAHVPVAFPAGLFTEPPVVVATVWGDARDTTANVDDITTEGCVIRLGSVSDVTRTIGAHWHATQM